MASPISSTHDARWMGAGFDTWGGSSFVQARLGLLGKTVFLLSGGFFVVMNGLLLAGGGLGILPALATQANLMHFLAASVMGALWAVAGGRPRSLRVLGWLDAGSLLLGGITLALMARFYSRQDESYAAKVLAALRNQFGGHAVKKADEAG